MTRGRAALLLLGLFFFSGCFGDSWPVLPDEGAYVPPVTRDQLENAPLDSLPALTGISFRPSLWRNFQPTGAEAGGDPLIASVRIFDESHARYSADLKARYVWVLTGSEVWASPIVRELDEGSNYLTLYSGEGPKWGPGITVDVVLGLSVPADSDSLSLVRFRDVTILRLD